jgi:hypothetical protein
MKLTQFFRSLFSETTSPSENSELCLLQNASASSVVTDPYPYIVIENALPPSVYEELEKKFPSEEQIRQGKKVANRDQLIARDILQNKHYPSIWRNFVAYHTSQTFYLKLLHLFASQVQKNYPWLEADLGRSLDTLSVGLRDPAASSLPDLCLDCQPGLNTVSLSPMTPRTAHLDAQNKLFTGLFYMKPDQDHSSGGDFLIHRLRHDSPEFLSDTTVAEQDLEIARVVPYQKNCAVFFMNSPLALHGVSIREGTPIPRRLVNIVAGLYTLKQKGLFTSPPRAEIKKMFQPHSSPS